MKKPFPPSTKPLQFKKMAIWGLLVTSTVTSTATIGLWATGEFNISSAQSMVSAEKTEEWEVSGNAKAFAASFAHDYFKWTIGKEEQRAKRLEPYLAAGMDPQAGISFSSLTHTARPEVEHAGNAISLGGHRSIIYVHAIVNYYNPKDEKKDFYKRQILAVPIKAQSASQFVVIDTPYLVPEPTKPKDAWKRESMPGQSVPSEVRDQIETALDSFFKVFAEGKDSEIQYLTRMEKTLHGYNGSMRFVELEQVEVVNQGNTSYMANVLVRMKETDTDMEVTYPYTVELIEEKGRWFVTTLNH